MKILTSCILLAVCIPLMANGEIVSQTYTSIVGKVIPDGTVSGNNDPLYDTINVPLGYDVAGVEIYIDVTILEWSSDLTMKLTSPMGQELRIFWIGEGGVPITNPIGWYPTNFTPKDDIDLWIGEPAAGDWVLRCQDMSYDVEGTLNEWRLKIIYDDALPAETGTWSGVKALYR